MEWIFFFNFAVKMVRVTRYTTADAPLWDDFVRVSRNGTFLFQRAYMDYHHDRFHDHSLLFHNEKGRVVALLPCNEDGVILHSHQGLTYGGFILAPGTHTYEVQQAFDATMNYLRQQGFKEWIYKQMPSIYHSIPSQEDDYLLWKNGAEMVECNLSSTVDYGSMPSLKAEYCRRNALTRLARQGARLDMTTDLGRFWPLLETCLNERHGVKPVHTLTEMQLLQHRFPDKIRCCTVQDTTGSILAGVIMYEAGQVAHAQYSTTTEAGRRIGAQDYLYLALINHYKEQQSVRFFDFGISNEDGGKVLNTSLNRYKEGFGARGVTYKKYRIML